MHLFLRWLRAFRPLLFAVCLAVSASTNILLQPVFSVVGQKVAAQQAKPTLTPLPTSVPTAAPTGIPPTPAPTVPRTPKPKPLSPVLAYPGPPILGRAAIVIDMDTGKVMYARNADQRMPMASTTKITTAILTLMHARLDDMAVASRAAATIGESTMSLRQGERLPVRDLLYGLMLNSGNDAAIALAEHVGGTQKHFVAMMNTLARSLGMTNTHYATPHGLDAKGHYTSARDLATIALFAMQNPIFRQVVRTENFHIKRSKHNLEHYLGNINKALYWYPGANGVKPGDTDAAGLCQVVTAYRNGHHVLAVVLHTPNLATDIRNLLNMGSRDFVWVPSIYAADGPTSVLSGGAGQHRWRYFEGAGHYVIGPFLDYFDQHGGLGTLGLPRTEQFTSHGRTVQYFQGGQLALDKQHGTVYGIALGRQLAHLTPKQRSAHHDIASGLRLFYQRLGGGKVFGPPVSGLLRVRGTPVQFFVRGELAATRYGPRIVPIGDTALRERGLFPSSGAANHFSPTFITD